MARRNWRKDDGRMVGPYGIPEEFLTQREKDIINGAYSPTPPPKSKAPLPGSAAEAQPVPEVSHPAATPQQRVRRSE